MSSMPQMSSESTLQIRSIGKGWLWIDNAVYDRYAPHIGITGLGLYLALARYANNKTAQCWPSLSRLATEMGTDVATLDQALERLQASGLIHVAQQPGKGTVLTLLAPPMTPPQPTAFPAEFAPAASPVETSVMTRDEKEQDLKQEGTKKTFVSSSFSSKKKTEEQNSSFAALWREKKPASAPDETSSWMKAPVAWTAARPNVLLEAATLTPDAYTALYHEAESALIAEGLKAFCLTTPVIEARMTLLLDQHVRVQVRVEGCLHADVDAQAGLCPTCGEVLASVATAR